LGVAGKSRVRDSLELVKKTGTDTGRKFRWTGAFPTMGKKPIQRRALGEKKKAAHSNLTDTPSTRATIRVIDN